MTIPFHVMLMLIFLCAVLIHAGYDIVRLRNHAKKTGHRLNREMSRQVIKSVLYMVVMYEVAVLYAVKVSSIGGDWSVCTYIIGMQTAFIVAVRVIGIAPALRTSASEPIQAEERPVNGPQAVKEDGVDAEPDCGDERA